MTDLFTVVLAKARTHTAESLGESKMAVDLRSNDVLWLWVSGRAGDARLPGTTAGGFCHD
jgi:hypothetical protein